ncbi:endonuclease/exonuclease/phosphatase family protein [Flexivirga meconopsidis]|uniref:endonuclease/exonuclease/phosphatase family protein n=1 Tax=Flexivirga meconopsidis TaxID=2977121 RepID=UPI0022406D9B|nr:endonuclease/exonuclease/phosphatase family protein [Flexivirga meconopsidis]
MTQQPRTPGRGQHQVRVASYNVRAWKDDRAALHEVIRAIDADILLLQEVPRHPLSGHRLAGFADELALTWFGGRRYRMSTTLMTKLRLDVLDAHHGKLTVRRGEEPRGYGIATVRLPGHRPLCAVSVHLSLKSARRLPQVEEIFAELGAPTPPTVLGGDLNEEPTGAVWKYLGDKLRLVSPDRPTFSAQQPVKRIDGIFASAGLPATAPDLGLDPALLARATDHLPVVVDLDLSALAEPATGGRTAG